MHEAVARKLFDAAVAGLTTAVCAGRGWRVHESTYPILDLEYSGEGRTSMRARFRCDGWNAQPPSITFHGPDGNALATLPSGPGNQFNNSAHPTTRVPFLCMAGSREYHTHPSHLTDHWENYRERPGYDLGGLVTQVWRAWQGTRP